MSFGIQRIALGKIAPAPGKSSPPAERPGPGAGPHLRADPSEQGGRPGTARALDVLGAPASMVGLYLSAQTLARILSNLLWQRLGRARGNLFLVKTASLLTALEPLLAVTLPWLMRLAGLTVESSGLLPAYLFTGVFLVAGATQSGRSISFMALLLDLAPDEERASYIGLVNTTLGFVSLLPILAGAIIDRVSFEPIFLVATGLLLLGYLVTLGWGNEELNP